VLASSLGGLASCWTSVNPAALIVAIPVGLVIWVVRPLR